MLSFFYLCGAFSGQVLWTNVAEHIIISWGGHPHHVTDGWASCDGRGASEMESPCWLFLYSKTLIYNKLYNEITFVVVKNMKSMNINQEYCSLYHFGKKYSMFTLKQMFFSIFVNGVYMPVEIIKCTSSICISNHNSGFSFYFIMLLISSP